MKTNDQTKSKKQLIEFLKAYPIVQIACEKSGVSRPTFYRWKAKDKKFAAAAEKATGSGRLLVNDMAESKLINAIKNENLTGIIFWLKNNHSVYSDKLEITGNMTTTKELTKEQEESIKRALTLADVLTEGGQNGK